MGQALGGERIRCECGSLTTTKITLEGAPLPSEPEPPKVINKEDVSQFIKLLMEPMQSMVIPDLKAIARHTGHGQWDGRIVRRGHHRLPEGFVCYTGFMCDDCADKVLDEISDDRWHIQVKKDEYRWGGLP